MFKLSSQRNGKEIKGKSVKMKNERSMGYEIENQRKESLI